MINLTEIIEQLRVCNDSAINAGQSSHFIEILNDNAEVTIRANREGLLWLALQLVQLAETGKVGSHYHLDESSMADSAALPVVFSFVDEAGSNPALKRDCANKPSRSPLAPRWAS